MAVLSSLHEVLEPLYEEIEVNYSIDKTAALTARYWYVPYVASALYLVGVYLGTSWMSKRKPYSIRPLLTLWNFILSAVSIMGTYVLVPDLWQYVVERGIVQSVCTTATHDKPMLSFWALVFVVSKIFEFGDTFFIVARKTRLQFLHWYHHVTVCVFSWYSLSISSSVAHWFCAMNFSVHSVMYSYYLMKALKIPIPVFVATGITLLQLLQFIVGFSLTVLNTQQYISGKECFTDWFHLSLGLVIYGSYFILFSRFFYQKYLMKQAKPKEQ